MLEQEPDVIDAREYLAVLGRQRRILVGTVLAVLALAALVTFLREPTYASTVRIAVEPPSDRDELERILFGTTDVSTQAAVLRSSTVVRAALEAQGMPTSDTAVEDFIDDQVEAEPVIDTTVIDVTVRDPDRRRAAAVAQAIAESYLEFVRRDAATRTRQAVVELETRSRATRAELRSIEGQLAGGPTSTRASLELERDELQAELRSIATRRAELETAAGLSRRGLIVQSAAMPKDPVSPKPALNLGLALVFGLGLGVAAAYTRDWRGDRVRDERGLRSAGGGPVLGVLRAGPMEPVLRHEPAGAASDAYRRVRAQLFAMPGNDASAGRLLAALAVGAAGDAGPVAVNLSLALARAGRSVVLVDADSRRGTATRLLARAGGTTPVAVASATGTSWTVFEADAGLRLCCPDPARPVGDDGLVSDSFGDLLAELRASADHVVVVAPPVEEGADALDIAAQTGSALVIAHAGSTTRAGVGAAVEALARIGVTVVGSVLAPPPGRRTGDAGRVVPPRRTDDEASDANVGARA